MEWTVYYGGELYDLMTDAQVANLFHCFATVVMIPATMVVVVS